MKRVIALILAFLLSGFVKPIMSIADQYSEAQTARSGITEELTNEPTFSNYSDPEFYKYINDSIYAGLVEEFGSEDFIVENVESVYISQEYIDEVAYNSKANIFFGYTLQEVEEVYQGQKFIFTLGSGGTTVVQPFEDYDDTYEQIIKNVAVGAGVILTCVTVSVVTGGLGLTTVSVIFAASAETAASFASLSANLGGLAAGIVKGIKTKDFDAALKAGALAASKGFKWGAISGAVVGGAKKACSLVRTFSNFGSKTEYVPGTVEIPEDIPVWRKAELRALNAKGGYSQLNFYEGELVPVTTPGATKPDVLCKVLDHYEAIEVKYYDLENASCVNTLKNELMREIPARIIHLPHGTTQRIILDVTDRGYTSTFCETFRETVRTWLKDIYPNIPIDFVGVA